MENLEEQLLIKKAKLERKSNSILILFILLTCIFIYSIIQNMNGKTNMIYLYIMIGYILMSFVSSNISRLKKENLEYLSCIERFKKRRNNQIDEYETGLHYHYPISLLDLHIVGEHSLFQYMNIAKTKQGKQKVINRFLNQNNDIDTYQEAIEILSQDQELLLKIECYQGMEDLEDLYSIFKHPNQVNYLILVFDLILDLICMISFFKYSIELGCTLLLLHYSLSTLYSKYILKDLISLQKGIQTIKAMQIYPKAVKGMLLSKISDEISINEVVLKQINRLDTFIHLDSNFISSLFLNGFFSFKLLIYYYERSLNLEKEVQRMIEGYCSLEELASFSYLLCLDPRLNSVSIDRYLLIEEGINPLVENCKANSFHPNNSTSLITGSNMSGKTSFLRMVGINVLLANACGKAYCKKMVTPIYEVFTSINVMDDSKNGISTFYGELKRIQEAMQSKNQKLILIDEIFKGTNYTDRMIGAKSVIHTLQEQEAMVIVTTHDYELCKIENCDHYYFKEHYEDDHILFDYSINTGINQESNALYLMKMLKMVPDDIK